jgi:dTMP kinase
MNSGKKALSKGLFITFEGIDQSGKSTQVERLEKRLNDNGYAVQSWRDPGSTLISEQIRDILLSSKNHGMNAITELLLYEAARAQIVAESVRPALEKNQIVIMDRFYDSTTAYQGYGRGLPLDTIAHANHIATGGLVPDLTFFIDVTWEESCRRKGKDVRDRMESESRIFFDKVRRGYHSLTNDEPERVRLIDGTLSKSVIEKIIWDHAIKYIEILN